MEPGVPKTVGAQFDTPGPKIAGQAASAPPRAYPTQILKCLGCRHGLRNGE